MQILTFKRLIGLAAIGGAVYVHKQRGGDWTMVSMRDTLRHLLATAADKLAAMDKQVQRPPIERAAHTGVPPRNRVAEDSKVRSYSEFTKRDDPGRH
jgi:hypothetical protein